MAGAVKIGDLDAIGRELVEAAKRATRSAAKRAPRDITENLRRGLKPDGTPQPRSADATVESKRREGLPLISGVATGTLSTASEWQVRATSSGYDILPPPDRAEVIDYLEPRGFVFVEHTPETVEFFSRELQREIDRMK